MRLANKVSVITGAGSGIGRASACLFAKEGAKVIVADINDVGGDKTVATIRTSGGDSIFVHTDVTVASEVEHLIRVAMDTFGKIDILFNNAGIGQKLTPIEDIDESYWDQILSINLKSVFLGTKYAVPYMKKAGSGVIINTSSMTGVRPRYRRKDKKQVDRDLEELLEQFPLLGKRRRQQARTLSGGEQQMLAIARALISRPELLLMSPLWGWLQ